jgi:hypothetical protein
MSANDSLKNNQIKNSNSSNNISQKEINNNNKDTSPVKESNKENNNSINNNTNKDGLNSNSKEIKFNPTQATNSRTGQERDGTSSNPRSMRKVFKIDYLFIVFFLFLKISKSILKS